MKKLAFLALVAIVCCSATLINKTKVQETPPAAKTAETKPKEKCACTGALTITNNSSIVMTNAGLTGNDPGSGGSPFSYTFPLLVNLLPGNSYNFPLTETAGGVYDLAPSSFITMNVAWQGTISIWDNATSTLLVQLNVSGGSTHFFQYYDTPTFVNHCNGLTLVVTGSSL